MSDPIVRREFQVAKDDGTHWLMQYTTNGTRWVEVSQPQDAAPASPAGLPGRSPRGIPRLPLDGIMGLSMLISSVAQGVEAWDGHQARRFSEAQVEEERRIAWLTDMMARWADAHQGDQLDLRTSEYLAREAEGLADALLENRKVQLPQSLMYELSAIQDVFANFRSFYSVQFEALLAEHGDEVQAAVQASMPGHKLNADFLQLLVADPSASWVRHVMAKTPGEFDQSLAATFRDPEVFLARLFPSTEISIRTEVEAAKQKRLVEALVDRIVDTLPEANRLWAKANTERLDSFRELILLRAEVSRVKALNAAWLAVTDLVQFSTGRTVEVTSDNKRLAITIGNESPTSVIETPSFETEPARVDS